MTGKLRYGGTAAEYLAFTRGAAVVDRSDRTRIEHAGADALDLLHRLTTNDLLEMPEGEARGTIVTNGDARIIDVLTVVRRPAQPLLLLGSHGRADAVLEWLDQYTFSEDSTPRDVSAETCQLTLVGPAAAEALVNLVPVPSFEMPVWRCGVVAIGGHLVEVVRTAGPGIDGFDLIAESSASSALRQALAAAGATPAGTLAYDAYRVARGIPEYGAELDERVNPHEANLLSYVSFTKGCYIGQEVVARLDTYDKVQRRLVRVRSEESLDAHLRPGMPLVDDARPVGETRTVAEAGPMAGHAALAYVRRGFWESDIMLRTGTGSTVRVEAIDDAVPGST
jgi:folate-binding protein YgfZ